MTTASPSVIEIANDRLTLGIVPAIGGGVARFDALTESRAIPLFRPWDGVTADPNALGCYPLVPFSNRLGAGGIDAGGRFWPMLPNMPPDPYPIHGDGWQQAWAVEAQSEARVVLALDSRSLPPFDYTARISYALTGANMTMRLEVEHRGAIPVHYGLGFHPWLPRTPGTTLAAPASSVWLEQADHLPDREVPIDERPLWDFRQPRPLPAAWINNTFTGWSGQAQVRWKETGMGLAIKASDALGTCIVFSPGADCDFFCFEPVSHPVDAHRLPGKPGLRLLGPGERFAVACRFTLVAG